jgi:hypothetical protein
MSEGHVHAQGDCLRESDRPAHPAAPPPPLGHPAAPSKRRRALGRFRRDEQGSLIVFGLFLMATAILIIGMAVDLMRVENRRAKLSYTLDRCTLSAASLRQTLDPETVLRDCMAREGLLQYLTKVEVTSNSTERVVSAAGLIPVDTFFMHMMDIDTIRVGAQSRAEQRGNRFEIVLALDVSGSMNNRQRIQGLRVAAKNFVDRVLAESGGMISIAIVPYAAQVNLPPALAEQFNITHRSGLGVTANGDMRRVNCVDFPTEVYDQTSLPPTMPIPASGWAELTLRLSFPTNHLDQHRLPLGALVDCPPSTTNLVRLPDTDPAALNAYIDRLAANGGTAINTGMKWAVALLDPQTRPVIDTFIERGDVPQSVRGTPVDFSDPVTTKVIILMTDGRNEGDSRLNDPYRAGPSPIFRGTDGNLSIHLPTGRPAAAGSNQYWVPHLPGNPATRENEGEWRPTSWGGTAPAGTRLTWAEVWQHSTASWVAWHLYARGLSPLRDERLSIFNTWRANFITQRGSGTNVPFKDDELQRICAAAKAQRVVIYGIAFSAPEHGERMIQQCSSGPGFSFRSENNAELNAIFQSIALNVSQLRLTN